MKKNLYDVLGITPEERKKTGVEFENILKEKFRPLAREWHPDRKENETRKELAEEKFKEIAEAKEILGDAQKRQQYDITGSTSGFNYTGYQNFHDIDLNDIMREFMSNRGFSSFGGNPFHNNQQNVYKGTNISLKITLKIDDVYNGTTKKYKYNIEVPCKHCNGGNMTICHTCKGVGSVTQTKQVGYTIMQTMTPCPTCNGMGKIVENNCGYCKGSGLQKEEKTVNVTIPRGIIIGNHLIMKGLGNHLPKTHKGEPGDLYVVVGNIESNDYQINDYDLIAIKEIPVLDILTGCEVSFILPDKQKVSIKVPKNTTDEYKFRVVGKGLPKAQTILNGDLYVFIKHKFPKNMDKDEIKIIEKLRKNKNFS
jgi:molecular chaperone DnaJ